MLVVGVFEGDVVYWRVGAQNLAGSGPWSQTWRIFLLAPPDDLEVNLIADDQASLAWDDNSDIEEGYILERRALSEDAFSVIDTVTADTEDYLDSELTEAGQVYRVKAYLGEETSGYSESVPTVFVGTEDESRLPTEYSLGQNYPNPFNPTTTLSYELPTASDVNLVVMDILGRIVEPLVTGHQSSGRHTVNWAARDHHAGGVYFYRIEAGGFVATRKMVLMK
jgi:hypothetical protein